MFSNILAKTKEKLFISFFTLLLVVSFIYLYLNYLQENYKNIQWSSERCISELSSAKYQLNVVTEYKNRIDKLLTETQKLHSSDKERFKDIMENCAALKQQSVLCQNQFDDLQRECKKVRQDYDEVLKELSKLKNR